MGRRKKGNKPRGSWTYVPKEAAYTTRQAAQNYADFISSFKGYHARVVVSRNTGAFKYKVKIR